MDYWDGLFGKDHVFLGRQTLYTSRTADQINESTIPDIINGAMQRHLKNFRESVYLKNYLRGDHPILKREKITRPEVNNRIVINNAITIVRNGNGYFLGEPIQFTAKKERDSDSVQRLNDYMDSEDKSCEDMNVGDDAAITGRGFRLTATDEREYADEAPFEIPTLESESTEVIYSTDAGHKPLLAFTHAPILDDNGNASGTTYTVYDDTYQYVYAVKGGLGSQIKRADLVGPPKAHFLGDVPIVEYANNAFRLGDFETVITILDALDKMSSDRVNDVEQIVNAILVFQGLHLKTKEENKDGVSDADKLRASHTLEFPDDGSGSSKKGVYYVSSNLDQSQAETLQQTLMNYVNAITGIPDRNDRAGGGQDTGDAVYLRDGYQALEVVARVKERYFRKAERRTLRMVCQILRRFDSIDLRPMDIDIKFIRNRTDNLLNKSNAFATFMGTKQVAPQDGIALIGITNDPKGMAQRGKDYWGAQAESAASATVPQTDGANAEGGGQSATTQATGSSSQSAVS